MRDDEPGCSPLGGTDDAGSEACWSAEGTTRPDAIEERLRILDDDLFGEGWKAAILGDLDGSRGIVSGALAFACALLALVSVTSAAAAASIAFVCASLVALASWCAFALASGTFASRRARCLMRAEAYRSERRVLAGMDAAGV